MKFVGGGVSRGPKEARSLGALPWVNTALSRDAMMLIQKLTGMIPPYFFCHVSL